MGHRSAKIGTQFFLLFDTSSWFLKSERVVKLIYEYLFTVSRYIRVQHNIFRSKVNKDDRANLLVAVVTSQPKISVVNKATYILKSVHSLTSGRQTNTHKTSLRLISIAGLGFRFGLGLGFQTLWLHSIITVRKRSCGKVMFLHLSVILFTGGVSASVHAGIHP